MRALSRCRLRLPRAHRPFHCRATGFRSSTRGRSAPTASPPSSAPSCTRRRTRTARSGTSSPSGCRRILRRPRRARPASRSRERAVEAGAFVAIAHPQWSSLTIEDGRALPMAHAVEIYNHGCALECARGDGAILLDALLNEGRSITAIATDDAHFRCRRRLRRLGDGEGGGERAGRAARGAEGRPLLFEPGAGDPRGRDLGRRAPRRVLAGRSTSRWSGAAPARSMSAAGR